MQFSGGRVIDMRHFQGDPLARVSLWNRSENRALGGTSAPQRRNLKDYLADNPDWIVREGYIRRRYGSRVRPFTHRKTMQEVLSGLEDWERVTLFDRRTGMKTSGRASPFKRSLVKYLRTRPYRVVYVGQDIFPVEGDRITDPASDQALFRNERLEIWDPVMKCRITGNARPSRKNSARYFRKYPQREIYTGQDEENFDIALEPEGLARRQDETRTASSRPGDREAGPNEQRPDENSGSSGGRETSRKRPRPETLDDADAAVSVLEEGNAFHLPECFQAPKRTKVRETSLESRETDPCSSHIKELLSTQVSNGPVPEDRKGRFADQSSRLRCSPAIESALESLEEGETPANHSQVVCRSTEKLHMSDIIHVGDEAEFNSLPGPPFWNGAASPLTSPCGPETSFALSSPSRTETESRLISRPRHETTSSLTSPPRRENSSQNILLEPLNVGFELTESPERVQLSPVIGQQEKQNEGKGVDLFGTTNEEDDKFMEFSLSEIPDLDTLLGAGADKEASNLSHGGIPGRKEQTSNENFESNGSVGGYSNVLDCDDLDEAIRILDDLPSFPNQG